MATGSTYPDKVTLLKFTVGAVVLITGVTATVFFLNKQDQESVKALDANPYTQSDQSHIDTVDTDSDSDHLSDCDDGSDCDDQDDRDNRPSPTGTSIPAASNSMEATTQADFAIEEEGIPAVDEKPAKTN